MMNRKQILDAAQSTPCETQDHVAKAPICGWDSPFTFIYPNRFLCGSFWLSQSKNPKAMWFDLPLSRCFLLFWPVCSCEAQGRGGSVGCFKSLERKVALGSDLPFEPLAQNPGG